MISKCELLSYVDKPIRKTLVRKSPYLACLVYSYGRKKFLEYLTKELPRPVSLPADLKTRAWGLVFRSPLFNASGMFKFGEGYELSYRQGAGAFLVGTLTPRARRGNFAFGVEHPFLPYPKSHASSNWMGLPNEGILPTIEKFKQIRKHPDFPLGVSVAFNSNDEQGVNEFLEAIRFLEKQDVDFIELNESCPNVVHSSTTNARVFDLLERLSIVSEKFLKKRSRNLPVIVKFSNDFPLGDLPAMLDALVDLGYDGVNFGNTSTNYAQMRDSFDSKERKAFDFFVNTFGGGVSGKPLKHLSLTLTQMTTEILSRMNLKREFIVVRTGGIDQIGDLIESQRFGVTLFQWFTGYFDNFSQFGHKLYQKVFNL